MTPERLAELRRIAEAATPGPWEWREREHNERIRKHERAGRRFRREFIYCLQGPPLRDVAPEYRDEFDYPTVMSLRLDDRVEASALTGAVPTPEDAEFIATFDPPTVLALLDEIERLRWERAQAASLIRSAIERIYDEETGDWIWDDSDYRHALEELRQTIDLLCPYKGGGDDE